MTQFLDKAGFELKTGDYIIFGHALGRCPGLRYGKVLAITEGREGYNKIIPKIKVQGVDSNDNWDTTRSPTLCRSSTLSFPSRILKIDESQMPKNVLDLLRPIKEEIVKMTKKNRFDSVE